MKDEKIELLLYRSHREPKQTLGILVVLKGTRVLFKCCTLEPPWRGNQKRISSIPAGTYTVVKEYSPKFKRDLYELKGVDNRSEIKLHPGTYYWHTEGCILLGDRHLKLNNDNSRDLRNGDETLERFHEVMGDIKITTIKIVE